MASRIAWTPVAAGDAPARCGSAASRESVAETVPAVRWELASLAALYHAGHDAARRFNGAGTAAGDVAVGAVVGAVAARVTTYTQRS